MKLNPLGLFRQIAHVVLCSFAMSEMVKTSAIRQIYELRTFSTVWNTFAMLTASSVFYLPVPDDATVNVLLVSFLPFKVLLGHDKFMHIRGGCWLGDYLKRWFNIKVKTPNTFQRYSIQCTHA